MKNEIIVILLLLSGFVITSCGGKTDVSDGFEKPGLSNIWSRSRMEKNAFSVQSAIVRNGHSAGKIVLRPKDTFEAGKGNSKDSERDELLEAIRLFSKEGKLYEYQFSLFLPDSFPIVPTRLVIAQWKQYCGGNPMCDDDSPVLAIRYVSGNLYITTHNDSAQVKIFETSEEIRNRWLDFRFKIRFSRENDGIVEGWLNEKQIINFKGGNCYTSKKGYPGKSRFYFKTGLYRDLMDIPMTIYIDEYQKKEITQ
jgi:hypothetical protein